MSEGLKFGILHWVYPFKSDCTRVSVSGNVMDKVDLGKLKIAGGNGKI